MAELSPKDVFAGDLPLERLLEDLELTFPLYNPSPDDSIGKILYLAGQRSVVEYIKSQLEETKNVS